MFPYTSIYRYHILVIFLSALISEFVGPLHRLGTSVPATTADDDCEASPDIEARLDAQMRTIEGAVGAEIPLKQLKLDPDKPKSVG